MDSVKFYEELKRVCENQQTSVTATLKACKVDPSSASKWKNAQTSPKPETVKRICDFLGITPADLGDTRPETSIHLGVDYVSPRFCLKAPVGSVEARLGAELDGLNDDGLEVIISVAHALRQVDGMRMRKSYPDKLPEYLEVPELGMKIPVSRLEPITADA